MMKYSFRLIGDKITFIDDQNAVANGFYLLHNVSGKQNGFVFSDPDNQIPYFFQLIGIESIGSSRINKSGSWMRAWAKPVRCR